DRPRRRLTHRLRLPPRRAACARGLRRREPCRVERSSLLPDTATSDERRPLGAVLHLEHVERPDLAVGPDRPALAVLRVAGGEVGAFQPGLEVVLGAPARQHEADVALIVRPQQLEGLEPLGLLDFPGTGGEALGELLEALAGDGDRVDLDDAHAPDPTGASAPRGTRCTRTARGAATKVRWGVVFARPTS